MNPTPAIGVAWLWICAMEDHPALAVLKSFFAEMNAWEKGVAARYKAIDWGNTSPEALARDRAIDRQEATAIFEKYCEVVQRPLDCRIRDCRSIRIDRNTTRKAK